MARDQLLVVDDHPINMKLISFLLELEGYEVRTAGTASEALALLESYRPRLILMDLQMPGMNGFELTQQLKAATATKDIIIVAVTAYAMKGDEQRARAAGCDDYITKPIDNDELPRLVARLLETAQTRTEVP
jgi:two-component system, cell cycle response regulator DivK